MANLRIKIKTNYQKDKLANYLEKSDLSIRNNQKTISVNVKNKDDVDIFLANISRYFFTLTLNKFLVNEQIPRKLAQELQKSFDGCEYIYKKLLRYLRNNNLAINVDDFIKYNLVEINSLYFNMLAASNLTELKKQCLDTIFASLPAIPAKTLIISLVSATGPNNFFITLTSNNEQLGSYTAQTIHLLGPFLKSLEIKKVRLQGVYNKEVINKIYTILIKAGFWHLPLIDRTVK